MFIIPTLESNLKDWKFYIILQNSKKSKNYAYYLVSLKSKILSNQILLGKSVKIKKFWHLIKIIIRSALLYNLFLSLCARTLFRFAKKSPLRGHFCATVYLEGVPFTGLNLNNSMYGNSHDRCIRPPTPFGLRELNECLYFE